jgi:hypothetical protein
MAIIKAPKPHKRLAAVVLNNSQAETPKAKIGINQPKGTLNSLGAEAIVLLKTSRAIIVGINCANRDTALIWAKVENVPE